MSRFICKHGIDLDQITCVQCDVEYQKSKPALNGGTRAADMTLREHYAGLAMQGLNANPNWADKHVMQRMDRAMFDADLLIAELAKVRE